MVEAIQCPSCQTRYGLRPARVRTGLRRAQCFRCGDVFHIELEVKRILATMEPAALAPATTANVPLATLAEAIQAPEAHAAEASPALAAHDLALPDLDLPEPEAAPLEPSPMATAPIMSMAHEAAHAEPAPDLAAFDLPPVPEAPAAEAAPEPEPEPGGTYASAKDAISRLFGDTPLAPSPAAALRGALSRDTDVDAGLKALEDTLGGVKPEALSTRPFAPAPAPVPELPDLPELPPLPELPSAPQAVAMAESDLPHSASTVRMTAADMVAAVSAGAPRIPEPPEITQDEVTMVLPPPPPPAPEAPADPSALRLRIGEQVYSGLDLPTIAKWIEEGRVLEDHQVTRGTSENWMDAAKVPALRAVFERMRRTRGGVDLPPPPSSIGDSGAKRGLFGGMFGKKD